MLGSATEEAPTSPKVDPGPAAGGGRRFSVHLLLLICVVIWGWTFVATRVCLEHLAPLEVVGLRFLIGLPVLLAIVVARRVPLAFGRADLRPLALGAGVFAVHFAIQAVALTRTSATNTGWIIAVSPLAIAALALAVLGERLSRREWCGVALASAGIVLLVSRGRLGELGWLRSWGDWLVLVSAFTWALYTILTRDLSRSRHPLAVTLVVIAPLSLLGALHLALSSRAAALLALPPAPVVALLFLGVLGTAAQWFWQEAVARLGAARSGIFLYLEPVATTVLAVPLLGESFGAAAVAGGAMVLAGVGWAEGGRRRDPDRPGLTGIQEPS